jgi:hypothetical protein
MADNTTMLAHRGCAAIRDAALGAPRAPRTLAARKRRATRLPGMHRLSKARPPRRQDATGSCLAATSEAFRRRQHFAAQTGDHLRLRAEPPLELLHLRLEGFDSRFQHVELRLEGKLLYLSLDSVKSLFDALQTGYQHVILSLKPVEPLVDPVKVPIKAALEAVDRVSNDTLHVWESDLPVKSSQDRDEVVAHAPYRTPGPARVGPRT